MERTHLDRRPLVARREALRVGALTALGLSLSDWLRLRAAAPLAAPVLVAGDVARRPRARSCILIWLDGGPSHIDTFDPKPDAPSEVRGPFRAIPTRVPGVAYSELLPATARLADRIAIVRSVTSPLGEHNFGSHYLLTGYKPSAALTYPSMGSVVARTADPAAVLPPYISAGDDPNGMSGPGYLEADYGPFVVRQDPRSPQLRGMDLDPPAGVSLDRWARRRAFVAAVDRMSRLVEAAPRLAMSPEYEKAFRLVTSSEAKSAFDLSQESPVTLERYGTRLIGQSCLLARRLVERGVPFVTVTDRGWDTHDNIFQRLREGYTGGSVGKVPILDRALSALLSDLSERGLLDETLVLVLGEFGRTPKINTVGGRDHWPRVFSVALAGGGISGGQVIGASDAMGESPKDRPVTPADLARTVFTILGVDPDREFRTSDGRPVRVNAGGEVISELVT
jgi:hypothetical protein